jgi:hypothetical protein
MAISKHEQLLRIKADYRKAHNNAPATARDIADWAVREGMYKLKPNAAERQLASELADAFRIQYMDDGHGHRVRVNHSVQKPQGSLWDEIQTISRDDMKLSVAQKRTGMAGEAKQIQRDLNYFNELHTDEPPLQTSFDFNGDLADEGLLSPFSSEIEQLVGQSPPTPEK